MARLCQNCRDPLPTSKKNPNQRFCGKKECQRARKRQWQSEKMHNDPDYKQNQQEANRNWQKKIHNTGRNTGKRMLNIPNVIEEIPDNICRSNARSCPS